VSFFLQSLKNASVPFLPNESQSLVKVVNPDFSRESLLAMHSMPNVSPLHTNSRNPLKCENPLSYTLEFVGQFRGRGRLEDHPDREIIPPMHEASRQHPPIPEPQDLML
jgi:hypothetical protein